LWQSRLSLPLLEKLGQQSFLLGDSDGCSRFVRPAGIGCGLLGTLADVVSDIGDFYFEV